MNTGRRGETDVGAVVLLFVIVAVIVLIAAVVVYVPRPAGPDCGNCNITLTGELVVGQNQTMWITDAEGADEVSQWYPGENVYMAWHPAPLVNGTPAYIYGTPPSVAENMKSVSCGKTCEGWQWGGYTPWINITAWVPQIYITVYQDDQHSATEYFGVVNATAG